MVFSTSNEIVFSFSAELDNVIGKYSTQNIFDIEINIDRYY